MNVPSEPSLAWISTILFLLGLFLLISGLNIIKIEKLSVSHGFRTWFTGLLLMLVAVIVAIPKILPYESSISSFIERLTTEEKFIGIDEELVAKAKSGNINAQSKLAVIFWERDNLDEAFIWDKKAALQGNVNSQIRMGSQYRNGTSPNVDYKEAAFWYKKVYEQTANKPPIAKILIELYSTGGRNLEKNICKAYQWALKYNNLIPKPKDSEQNLEFIEEAIFNQKKKNDFDDGWFIGRSPELSYFTYHDKNLPSSSCFISHKGSMKSGWRGGIQKKIEATDYAGKKVKLSGKIAFLGYQKADIFINMQSAETEKNKKIAFTYINNSEGKWTSFESIVEAPSFTKTIYLAVNFYNGDRGAAWFDDFSFDIVPSNTEEKYDHLIHPGKDS